ncbi:MAG: cell division protein FtsI (penicillin-binding protein 3) [Parcubacteria group bacterium LiPW_15]|nr:MAG: cell division protein FtsI (penicillin-binding protein 3) [Parcubacteria group bacterium LiPW_15]
MGARFASLIAVVTLCYGFLLFHLYEVQITKGSSYLAQAEAQISATNSQASRRGIIYFADKDGGKVPAALNKDFNEIYAVPKEIEDIQETTHQLSLAFNVPAEDLEAKLSDKMSQYSSLFKKAPNESVFKIQELNIKGVYAKQSPDRFYPFGTTAAQVIGFVGPDDKKNGEVGRYGLEKFYDNSLSGADSNNELASGEGLVLTIDPNIQRQAEQTLEKLIRDTGSPSGSVIVEDPNTGKILAAASFPNYDPNTYSTFSIKNFTNPITEAVYEPGSVFKVFTMAAGIDAGKITPDTTYYDSGSVTISGKKISNWDLKAHGKVTMTNVIEQSLNTGTAFAVKTMGSSVLTSYIKKFGFGEKANIDLPGELKGNVSRLVPKAPAIAFATAGFGQGVSVTPIQLINAVSAIANGGKLMRPYLNANSEPQLIREVISADTARAVTKMMVSAVDKAGVAKIDGFSIAGKTGTAQIPDFKKGGYSDRVVDTYVGFGPTVDPKFVALIKIDDLPQELLAGTTVVPAFKELGQFILHYYDVAPDRITK